MRTLVLCLLLCGVLLPAVAQTVEFQLAFRNTTPTENKTYNFVYAAHPLGSNDVDTALGEREIPSLPPPAGVYIVYTVPPASDYIWLSPKDVRKYKVDSNVRHDYETNVLWTGGRLEIALTGVLPALVDSAYIVDAITDFPDNFIKYRIGSPTPFTTDNPALTRFRVLVWYRASAMSVAEVMENTATVVPNPAEDALRIVGGSGAGTLMIRNACGEQVHTIHGYMGETFSIATLAKGVYFAQLTSSSGVATQTTFIKR